MATIISRLSSATGYDDMGVLVLITVVRISVVPVSSGSSPASDYNFCYISCMCPLIITH